MKSAPFQTPIGKNSPYRPNNTKRVGYHSGRIAFRISDGIHSIGECLAKTGMEEKAFRKLYSKINSRKAPATWEAFDGK